MKDIKYYLEQTNTILLTKDVFEWLKERASALDKIKAEIKEQYGGCGLINDGLDMALSIIDKYMAESSLAESTSEIPNKCEDAISRQAVLDLIYNSWKHNGVGENYGELSIDALKELPPVTPKQKMGRWIREKKHHKDDFQEFDYWDVRCSECGARKRIGWTNIRHCPMCGVKMSENPTGSESEDTE